MQKELTCLSNDFNTDAFAISCVDSDFYIMC